MPISGGGPREAIRPLDYNEPGAVSVRGNHRLGSSTLNVHNPQQGYIYYWCRHPRHDRGGAMLQQFLNEGWELVTKQHPEYRGRETDLHYSELGLDGYQAHGDVLLIRMHEDQYREWKAARDALKEAQSNVDGGLDEYLEKARGIEEKYGSNDKPLYYRTSGHGTFIREY